MTNHEQILLGQAMQDNTIAIASGINFEMFEDTECRRGWHAIISRVQQGGKADQMTLLDSGLSAALVGTLSDYPTANWQVYAGKVRNAYARKQLRKVGAMLSDINAAQDPQDSINDVLDRLQDISHTHQEDRPYTLKELAGTYIDKLEERQKLKGEIPGILGGIPKLDSTLLGFEPSKYYVFGARPSEGKSALLVTLFSNMVRKGHKVGMLSLESSRNEIIDRMIAQASKVNSRRIKTGTLTEQDMGKVYGQITEILKENAIIYDEPNSNIGVLQMQAKYMVQRHGIEALFVDYIQIIKAHDRSKPQHEQIAEISIALKQLARELKIPVITAAQLKRDAHGRRPNMADLGGSTQIERDADVVGLLYHRIGDEAQAPNDSWVIIEKHRDGETGDIPVFFQREYATFVERVIH